MEYYKIEYTFCLSKQSQLNEQEKKDPQSRLTSWELSSSSTPAHPKNCEQNCVSFPFSTEIN